MRYNASRFDGLSIALDYFMNPHKDHPATLGAMFASLWRNRRLIWQMARREIDARYRGSLMGLAWSFITPFVMLAVYTFVFSVVFKARWGLGENESRTDFAIMLFAGMIVFGLFSEIINRSPGLVTTNANYVKKVVFPLEILPWVAFGSSLFHSLISLVVLLLAQLVLNFTLPWTVIFFPFVMLPLIFFSMGFAWFLSALGVFVRDIGQVTGLFTTLLMFLSAVFFPVSSLPEQYQIWLKLNPLVLIITESRKSLILGQTPDWAAVLVALLASLIFAFAGFWWFQKVRKGFADVI
jgi:lipopolysaccharide transport system permease protein